MLITNTQWNGFVIQLWCSIVGAGSSPKSFHRLYFRRDNSFYGKQKWVGMPTTYRPKMNTWSNATATVAFRLTSFAAQMRALDTTPWSDLEFPKPSLFFSWTIKNHIFRLYMVRVLRRIGGNYHWRIRFVTKTLRRWSSIPKVREETLVVIVRHEISQKKRWSALNTPTSVS